MRPPAQQVAAHDLEDRFGDGEIAERVGVVVDGLENCEDGGLVAAGRRQAGAPDLAGGEGALIEGGAERDAVDDVPSGDGFAGIARRGELVGDDGEAVAEGLDVLVEVLVVEAFLEEIAEQRVEGLAFANAVEQLESLAHAIGGDVEGEALRRRCPCRSCSRCAEWRRCAPARKEA